MSKLIFANRAGRLLSKVSKPVKYINRQVKDTIGAMQEEMFMHAAGGISAPQVGVLKRIIIFGVRNSDVISCNKSFNLDYCGTFIELINPEYVLIEDNQEEQEEQLEGCLSIPGKIIPVKRYKTVHIVGKLLNKQDINLKCSGLTARIVQHEIDHLNGILINGK